MIKISREDKNALKLLEIEKSSLKSMLIIQKNLNRQILTFLKNFFGNIKININFKSESTAFKYINEATDALGKSNENIEKINLLLEQLDKISATLQTNKSVSSKVNKYNITFTKYIDLIYNNTNLIEKFIHKISLLDLSKVLKEINEETIEDNTESSENSLEINSETLNSSYIENTLVISEMQGKVILPYTIQEINDILKEKSKEYSSIDEVIEKLYTKPIKYYRFSEIARFKEAYKLVIEKEHKSKFKALSLASELFSTLNLHPAIITACKSLDELDIYLACLEDNSLNEFPFFEIKYEIAPKVQKQENSF